MTMPAPRPVGEFVLDALAACSRALDRRITRFLAPPRQRERRKPWEQKVIRFLAGRDNR
jgi:hypothetical protein